LTTSNIQRSIDSLNLAHVETGISTVNKNIINAVGIANNKAGILHI
jgi:hypothetical protein